MGGRVHLRGIGLAWAVCAAQVCIGLVAALIAGMLDVAELRNATAVVKLVTSIALAARFHAQVNLSSRS